VVRASLLDFVQDCSDESTLGKPIVLKTFGIDGTHRTRVENVISAVNQRPSAEKLNSTSSEWMRLTLQASRNPAAVTVL
jgi:hypothetical protein